MAMHRQVEELRIRDDNETAGSVSMSDTLAAELESVSLYLHVPFCLHHCGYCDFTVVAGRDGLIGQYLEALSLELATLETPRVVNTVFLGGGTPTHLAPQQLEELLQLVHRWFRPAANYYEFSVEANPANLDEARVEVLAAHGVNRISLGVQAFDADVLAFLERDHRLPEIERAMRR